MSVLDVAPLQARYDEAVQGMTVLNQMVIDSGEDFTAEQQAEYDRLNTVSEQSLRQIKRIQDANSKVSGMFNVHPAGGSSRGSVAPGSNPGVAVVTVPGGRGVSGVPGGVNVRTREGFESDPKCGFRDIHDFLNGVMDHGQFISGRRSNPNDQRINYLSSLNTAMRTGFLNDCSDGSCDPGGSTSDLTGSVFVPIDFAPEMFKTDATIPSGAFRTTRRTTRGMAVERKYRLDKDHRQSLTGGFQVGRNYEHCCNVSSAAEYSKYTVNVHPLYGAYCASDMLMETNPQMIIQEVEDGFRTEFEGQRIVEILNGAGNGEYKGVWKSNAIIKVAELTPGTLQKADIYRMGERLWRGTNREAVWLAGLNFESKLKTLQDTTTSTMNHFLYDPNAGPDWADGMLDGKPIVFTEFVPGYGFLGGLGLYVFSEFEEYTWRPMRMASSMHARFICNETVMKFWTYTGGQCRWDSTLIPKCVPEGEDVADHTLAPFVLLDGDPSDCPKPSRVHKKKPE